MALLRFKFLQKRTIVIKNYHTVAQHILYYMLLSNCQITMVLILLFYFTGSAYRFTIPFRISTTRSMPSTVICSQGPWAA